MQPENNLKYFRLPALAGLVFSVASSLYCLLAIFMAASLSGAPNYAIERAEWNKHVWSLGFLASVLASFLCIWILVRSRRRVAPPNSPRRYG
jgi:hypothetical protein